MPQTDISFVEKELKDYWKNDPDADLSDDWITRYSQEAHLILQLDFKTALDLGSGPGGLGQIIMDKKPNVVYDCVDTESAKRLHIERNYKGDFFVKDLEKDFDTNDLLDKYDVIILNDVLEHVRNPSLLLTKILDLMNENSVLFVSVPNWRMGHGFIYPGLFDFDNIILFFHQHKYKIDRIYGSALKCSTSRKLDSERNLPDDLIDCWNWYFVLQK